MTESRAHLISTKQQLLGLIAPLHGRWRAEKVNCFFEQCLPSPGDSLLDVGGGLGIQSEFSPLYRFFRQVEIVNLDPMPIDDGELGHVRITKGDACELHYKSVSFDWVFSNAVIEHVGGSSRQQRFAQEVRRVARKGYFVATPDRFFPLEPHTLLPLYQFLSPKWQLWVCQFSAGYLRSYEEIRLLSAADLQSLFPGARIRKMGFPVWPNNLVAYRRFEDASLDKTCA